MQALLFRSLIVLHDDLDKNHKHFSIKRNGKFMLLKCKNIFFYFISTFYCIISIYYDSVPLKM